eukprot:scaffold408_cov71-Cylindrotheca_fusiformis.AAC.28
MSANVMKILQTTVSSVMMLLMILIRADSIPTPLVTSFVLTKKEHTSQTLAPLSFSSEGERTGASKFATVILHCRAWQSCARKIRDIYVVVTGICLAAAAWDL